MNELLLMGSALYNYINTLGTITTYYQKAPQSATVPFVIIQLMSATDDYSFTDQGINADYSIKVISDRNFPLHAIQLYGSTHSLIQDGTIAVEGNSVLRIRRESIFQFEDSEHFWNVGGIYNFNIWQT